MSNILELQQVAKSLFGDLTTGCVDLYGHPIEIADVVIFSDFNTFRLSVGVIYKAGNKNVIKIRYTNQDGIDVDVSRYSHEIYLTGI